MKRGQPPRDDATRERVVEVFGAGQKVQPVKRRPRPEPRGYVFILAIVCMFVGIALAAFFGMTRTAVAVVFAPMAVLLLLGSSGEDAAWRRSQQERRARQRRLRRPREASDAEGSPPPVP